MFSPIRSLCFNDDRQTFTIVLPSQYKIFRCDPFGPIFSRDCEELSLGGAATCNGYRLIALTGSPSPAPFNSKSIRVFDHQNGQVTFDHQFPDHVLTMALSTDTVVCAMHCKIEVWNTRMNNCVYSFTTGLNVHVPLCLSKDARSLLTAGDRANQVSFYRNMGADLRHNTFVAEDSPVSLVKFSDNYQYFATAAFKGATIRIWEYFSTNCVGILARDDREDIIQTMDFSPNSQFFACCNKDGIVKVFNITRKSNNPSRPMIPACSCKLSDGVHMPRICWLSNELIGVITLEGESYRLTFTGTSLEKEEASFLKRVTS